MKKQNNFVAEFTKLLEKAKTDVNVKYLTTKQINDVYGIPSKLDQTNLSITQRRYIASVRQKKGGRRKYFERKVMDRMFQSGRVS